MSVLAQFAATSVPPEAEVLRGGVRAFLTDALAGMDAVARAQSWMGFDEAFSRKLASRGWVGMTLPTTYGGGGTSAFARYVVAEELLAAGAPVSAHWFADRQSGPLLLRHGTDAQKQALLPAICRGELYFCIGMSEPDSGSDLASIRTRADRTSDGGWALNGRKVWTTNAHRCHYMIALVRTEAGSERQQGLSQLLIDLRTPGIDIRPIRDLTGDAHFNEVTFDDVQLPADAVIGVEGSGWEQVVSELAFERSGPERFLSAMALIHTLIAAVGPAPDRLQATAVGRLVARLAALRAMSLAVTAQLEGGSDPVWAASCVKDLGTGFEQEIAEAAYTLIDAGPLAEGGSEHQRTLALTMQLAPSYSLRGGTREILRGIIARGLGLR